MEQQILVFGEPLERLPKDLYIPPEALRVLLTAFEGPLDLLLYLIRKQNMDILDIEVALITEQYLAYMNMMETLDIALAAEYLLMAATLAEIKARMLLPRPPAEDGAEEEDPRAELAERLLAYAKTAKAAERLAQHPRLDCGLALSAHSPPAAVVPLVKPDGDTEKLLKIISQIWQRQALKRAHEVEREAISLSERVNAMENRLREVRDWLHLHSFSHADEGRAGLVVSLMAMLELDRSQVLEWQQETAFADVLLRLRAA